MSTEEEEKKHIPTMHKLLIAMSISHTILTVIIILSIYFYTVDIDSPVIDAISAFVPISFLFFKKCIYEDIGKKIKLGQDTPEYTDDNYYFNKIQMFFFGGEIISKTTVNEYKNVKVTDVGSFKDLDDIDLIADIFNEKIHYIVINCVLIVMLLTKYNMKKLIPLFLVWFYYNFSK